VSLEVGSVLADRYEILKLLGEGGMGAVYKARDRELDRLVALKVIRPELAGQSSILQRFKQELILARKITHRNIIRIYDLGVTEGIRFITMEFVEGQDLSSLLEERKYTPEETVKILRQVCAALEAAHGEGVVHRDLKPQNIMIESSGRVVVMDFGLARSTELTGMTQVGTIMGTPAYMSPEQAKGMPADGRSDIFSLGIIAYQMLTGDVPYKADTMFASMALRTQGPPPPPIQIDPTLPQALSDIILKSLATNPQDRYQGVGDMFQDLDAWQEKRIARSIVTPRMAMITESHAKKWITLSLLFVFAIAVAVSGALWFTRKPSAAAPIPVSVLIADFNNATSDPVFNGTLEPAFQVALEGATFITAYDREAARRIALVLQPGATRMDEKVAQLVAQREGIGVVVAGSITSEGASYRLSARAIDAFNGKLVKAEELAGIKKDGVLLAAARLAARVRSALRDDTPESLQVAAAETFSAASVEAAHAYALGRQFEGQGKAAEAIHNYTQAVVLDPNLGRAYANLAALHINQGQKDEAEKDIQMAVQRIDRMSDREKHKTLGIYYLRTRNTEKAIEELTALVKQYPADNAGLKNLALAYFYQRDLPHAMDYTRRAVQMYPKNVTGRSNLALYAMYAGDFETAEREARTVLGLNPQWELAHVVVALSELGQGRLVQAEEAYHSLEKISPLGAEYAACGLADLALYQGLTDNAEALLERAIEQDLANKKSAEAAIKTAVLASVHLDSGRRPQMLKAADQALALSKDDNVRITLARVYAEAGLDGKALALASELGKSSEPDPSAYAKLIQGEVLLHKGSAREALKLFEEGQKLADTWLGRFDLGLAYLAANQFAEAYSELELCLKRRGEATALFLDDIPSYHYFPPVYYYLGRAQEGLKSPAAADSYKAYIATKEKAGHDRLLTDARRRLKQ
jgi:Flp pilus assembly protein TadD/predicted Ser/Thr protein kinase